LFLDDKRPEIKKAHPDYKVSDVAKEAGALWSALSAAEKKV
jgi:hypothetical protein